MLGTRWKSSIRNSPIESHPRAQGEGPRNLVVHVRTTESLRSELATGRLEWRTGVALSARLGMTCKEAALLAETRCNLRLATAARRRRETA
jgi:hypothetical protein